MNFNARQAFFGPNNNCYLVILGKAQAHLGRSGEKNIGRGLSIKNYKKLHFTFECDIKLPLDH